MDKTDDGNDTIDMLGGGRAVAILGSGDKELQAESSDRWNVYLIDGDGDIRYSEQEVIDAYDQLFGTANPIYRAFMEEGGVGGEIILKPDTVGNWLAQVIADDLEEVTDYIASGGGVRGRSGRDSYL